MSGTFNYFHHQLINKKMSEEELQEQIIQQIEVLVEELGGTMCHLTKCSYTGRQSKVYRDRI